MNRRAFVVGLGAVLVPPLAIDAQQSAAILDLIRADEQRLGDRDTSAFCLTPSPSISSWQVNLVSTHPRLGTSSTMTFSSSRETLGLTRRLDSNSTGRGNPSC